MTRMWIAPVGAELRPPLGELENGDLVVPERDGVRIWPDVTRAFTDIRFTTTEQEPTA